MGQGKRIRIRRSAAVWRGLFSRQSSSGVSVPEFCRREGINASRLRRWRSTLQDARKAHRAAVAAQPLTQGPTPFIDLGDLRPAGSRFEVQLELGRGVIRSIARG